VPASLKLQEQFGDDLQVIFVECQGADMATSEAFAWRQGWMGTQAMWTTERPVQVEGRSLPKFALLDREGKLLLSGNPLDQKKDIEKAIAEQVKRLKSPPEGTPARLSKAWAAFAKGDLGAALAECDRLAAADEGLAAAAKSLRAQMVAAVEAKVARGQWLIENGYIAEAAELLAELVKATKGCADVEGKVAAELARVTQPDEGLAAEAEASRALTALQQKMVKDKPFEEANLRALTKLAEKYASTQAGRRAARLVELAKIKS
jgi:hypothetical protein